jgi:DNA-binding SARP family transcriptional activator
MLWDRVSAAQARTSFRQALSELISAMGPLASELISTGRATVRLNTNACWIDALALLESSSSHSSRADLAVLCAGQLLEGSDEVSGTFGQWLATERIRLKERLSGSLDAVLLQMDRPGCDPNQLAAIARRLISFDPAHQGASRALMRIGKIRRARTSAARIRTLPRSADDRIPGQAGDRVRTTLPIHPRTAAAKGRIPYFNQSQS